MPCPDLRKDRSVGASVSRPHLGNDPSDGTTPEHVRVRQCRVCGADDLRCAFGRAVPIDSAAWSCPRCGGSAWTQALLEVPADPGRPVKPRFNLVER